MAGRQRPVSPHDSGEIDDVEAGFHYEHAVEGADRSEAEFRLEQSQRRREGQVRLQTVLRVERAKTGLTQDEVSRLTGINKSILSRIENGVIENPRFDMVARLCYVYNVPLEEVAARTGLPVLSSGHNRSDIADPKLRVALDRLLSSTSPQWRNHIITTLWMLVAGEPRAETPAEEEDLWLAGLSDPDESLPSGAS